MSGARYLGSMDEWMREQEKRTTALERRRRGLQTGGGGGGGTTDVRVADTPTIDMTISGNGSAATPYIVSGAVIGIPPAVVTVTDSGTIDLTVSGSGTAASPRSITADVTAVPVAKLTGPGTIAPALLPAIPLQVADTASVDMTITGAGTSASPFVLSATATGGGSSAALSVADTATIDLTLSGIGTAGSPWVLSGAAIALPPPTALDAVINLDTLMTYARYYQASNTSAATAGLNYPVPYAGWLRVDAQPNGALVYQEYQPYAGAVGTGFWRRSYRSSTGLWSAWVNYVPIAPVSPKVDIFTTVGAGTWTKPTGARRVRVRVQGGGGAGGGVLGNATAGQGEGGGGASGSYAEAWYDASALGATEALTVGGASAGVAGTAGTAGGNSTFKGLTAPGGGGGGVGTAGTGTGAAAGGTAAAATGGDINVQGTAGSVGRLITGLAILQGNGGSSLLGLGGSSPSSAGNRAATGFGAGGSGAFGTTANIAGGAGSPGVVIVETWF